MVLKALEIQGFKSFPDKVRIAFDEGVTGVVGPNGSGKSNLSDAVRWVLGETSSRELRSAGKMEDVIFGGTRRRGAMGYASVRLTLDNHDHFLDLDADEVVIGRKYYRSGESEYSINGKACRLKDIYELLLDTGIGRDGYSIISQGRISEIVAAKGAERREMFEEACGIAKYRYRKTEAERRLASAQENLERLRDILDELESRVGPLAKESEKAEKFLALSARRKSLEVTLWVEQVRAARENARRQQRDYETAEAEYQRFDRAEKAAQQETEEIRMQAQRLTVAVERLNGDIRSITEQISSSESRIAVLENDIEHGSQNMAALRAEIDQSGETRDAEQRLLEEERARAEAFEREAAELASAIGEMNRRLEEIQTRAAASGNAQEQVRAALAGVTARQTEARVAAATAKAGADAARERLPDVQEKIGAEESRLAELEQNRKDTRQYLDLLTENEKRLSNIRSGLALKLEGRQKALAQADEAEQKLSRELEGAGQRLSVLRELEKNMDGYQNSVKAVMRAASARRLKGIIGPVSSVLEVEPGCEVAVETALGGALQNIVVENEAAAKAAIALLRAENAGRATFLPLDTVQPGTFRGGPLSGTARLASELVRADARYQNIVSHLLGRIVVTEEINEASRTARALGYRNRVVTMDGQVINAGGSFTGGSVQRSAGLFTRKQEMEQLHEKILRLEKEYAAAQDRTDECKAQADALAAELTAADSERLTAGNDRVQAEAEEKRLAGAIEQAAENLRQRQQEAAALEEQAARQTEAAQKAEADGAALDRQAAELTDQLERLARGDDEFLADRSRLAEELAAKRLEQLARQKDAELCRSRIEAGEQRAREGVARRAGLEESLRAQQAQNEASRAAIEAIRRTNETSRAEIAEKEEAIRQSTRQRLECQKAETEAQAAAREAAGHREDLGREMARLAERKNAAEAEYDQSVARLWDEYQLTVTQAETLCVEYDSLPALRTQVAEVRGKIRALGSVNVGAVEEYKEVKQRYDALKAQVEDVEGSKNRLTRMIGELSGQMREIFSDSFRAINEQFGSTFRELFGGGDASLILENPADVLTGGIEIQVSPPGKVIRNLEALSGGERALVAISIYFAILAIHPAPFCILDEIEAALDDANVTRFAQYLRRISGRSQFIVITHRRGTMEAADLLYGVTMQEDGISKLLKLDLEQVDATLIS